MATLNITFNGISADYHLDVDAHLSDHDIRRIAVELVRSRGLPAYRLNSIHERIFDDFVIDRHDERRRGRIYLRPKVPFGARLAH